VTADRPGINVSACCYTNSQGRGRSWRTGGQGEETVAKPSEGYHVVRSHLRRSPRTGAGKLDGWTIPALIAGVWLGNRHIGFGEAAPATPDAPQPSVPVPVRVSAGAGR